MSQPNLRRTQRQPLACQQCTKAKVRCTKDIPCMRCRTRRLDCSREEVLVVSQTPIASPDQTRAAASHSPLSARKASDHASALDLSPPVEQPWAARASSSAPSTAYSRLHRSTEAQTRFEDIPTAIEGLAWGRHQCHAYPHTQCRRLTNFIAGSEPQRAHDNSIDGLPSVSLATSLVHQHVYHLAWYHNTLHIPTLMAQCTDFWTSGVVPDQQWMAVYCAVLSTAAWTNNNLPAGTDRVGTADGITELLFERAVKILFENDFMGRHTLHSIQAVCILGMVANVLGRSDLYTTLVNAAIRIAQCLGLHRIPDEGRTDSSWHDRMEREVGRRVWWKLVELDYHSMPYTGTLSIHPASFSTKLPLNCNDTDLKEQDRSVLTVSSFGIIMARVARLMPDVLDRLYSSTGDAAKYDCVLEADRRMREMVAGLPAVVLRKQDPSTESMVPWIATARRTLAISAADKIIMIHRPFMLKSFQSPLYLFTRNTCVSAATTILREHEELAASSAGCFGLWVHSAFAVTAIVVLCLNVLYSDRQTVRSHQVVEQQLDLIARARGRLAGQKSDSMARRGVYLIDALLAEREHMLPEGRQGHLDLDHIIEKFLQGEEQDRSTTPPLESIDQDMPLDLAVEVPPDFEQWFHQMFG